MAWNGHIIYPSAEANGSSEAVLRAIPVLSIQQQLSGQSVLKGDPCKVD
jgi:hypothetical protein